MLLSGLFIGLGILLLYQAIELKSASLASAMICLAPVITLFVEWFALGQSFSPWELLGMSIVISGAVLLTLSDFGDT